MTRLELLVRLRAGPLDAREYGYGQTNARRMLRIQLHRLRRDGFVIDSAPAWPHMPGRMTAPAIYTLRSEPPCIHCGK